MRRSKYIALALMGTTSLSLAACGEPVETGAYQSIAQCAADYDQSQCEQSFNVATGQHEKVAPKYRTKEDCEADFGAGNCEPPANDNGGSSSSFMPLMAGFLLGNMLADSGRGVAAQPVYRSYENGRPAGLRTARNHSVGSSMGKKTVNSASSMSRAPRATTTTLSRGGFGARGSYGG